jgi:hypothetical protein
MTTFLELDMHKLLAKSVLALPLLLRSVEKLNAGRLVGMRKDQMRAIHMVVLPETEPEVTLAGGSREGEYEEEAG